MRAGDAARAALAVGATASWLATGAAAEVWPQPGDALARGPWALLDCSPLAAWTNPAAMRPSRHFAAGAAHHLLFDLEEWSRLDAAAAARLGGAELVAGWTRFGAGELAAQGFGIGAGAPLAGERLRAGAWLRRHQRHGDGAFAADLGALAAPVSRLRVAVVARSALRGGEPAPDAEWEIAAAWDDAGGGAAASLARDASGPLALTVATRLALGPARAHASLTRLAGGETRAALAIVAVLPGGASLGAVRDIGPRLPDSRALVLTWDLPPATAPPPRPEAPPPPARDVEETDEEHVGAAAEVDLERQRRALEQRDEEDVESAPSSPEHPPPDRARAGAGARAPQADRPRAAGELRAAAIGGPPSAIALHGVGSLSWPLSPHLRAWGTAALSKDAGERRPIDEARLSFALARGRTWTLLAGDLDARLGGGLVVNGPVPGGGVGMRIEEAARPGRAPVPAGRGGALAWTMRPGWRAVALGLHTRRDSRLLGGAMSPIGGRYHRSALEIARRGALEETLLGAGVAASLDRTTRVALAAVRGRYAPARRLPGGRVIDASWWFSLGGETSVATARIAGEGALSGGGNALALGASRSFRRGALASASLRWHRGSDGYAAATAWPGSAVGDRLETSLRWRPPRPLSTLRARALEERWSAPYGVTDSDRRGWRREVELDAEARRGGMNLAAECGWQMTRREPTAGAALFGDAVAGSWLGARAEWQASDAVRLAVGGRVTRRSGAWREQWRLVCERRWVRGSMALVEIGFRPGAAASETSIDADPLGGVALERSPSPSRMAIEFTRPLGRGTHPRAEFGVRLSARALASSESPRVGVWSWIGSGEVPGARPYE